MKQTDLHKIRLFRIIHIDNLAHTLKEGILIATHPKAALKYVSIGDKKLIGQRNTYPVKIKPPNGTLGDYVAFYFAGHSPMLYNIKTGHRGIRQYPQQQIVYVVCRLEKVIATCADWCFTDGHAKHKITNFYNDLNDLDNIDWNVVESKQWCNDESQGINDRMRRKQAEFLVKNEVPVGCIAGIITFDEEAEAKALTLIREAGLALKVFIDKNKQYYY